MRRRSMVRVALCGVTQQSTNSRKSLLLLTDGKLGLKIVRTGAVARLQIRYMHLCLP